MRPTTGWTLESERTVSNSTSPLCTHSVLAAHIFFLNKASASLRMPASGQGIFGLRSSWGSISLEGVVPLVKYVFHGELCHVTAEPDAILWLYRCGVGQSDFVATLLLLSFPRTNCGHWTNFTSSGVSTLPASWLVMSEPCSSLPERCIRYPKHQPHR